MSEPKPKTRKVKIELREAAKPLDPPRALPSNHPAAELVNQVLAAQQAANLSIATPTPSVAPPDHVAPTLSVSPTLKPQAPLQTVAGTRDVAPTPDVGDKGYTRMPNAFLDDILPTLKPVEQVVIVRLYRLTRGFGKDRCTVSVPTLAKKCNIGTTAARLAIQTLVQRGCVRRIRDDFANPDRQSRGIEIEMLLGEATPTRGVPLTRRVALTGDVTATSVVDNKYKDIKKDVKSDSASPDYSKCPDCKGTGFFYPHGLEKGVVKCSHPHLQGK